MCLTIPARVLAIENPIPDFPVASITVEDSRGIKEIKSLWLPDLKVGDWVLYAYDTAIRKVSEEDAREILELLEPKRHIDVSSLDREFLDILKSHSTRKLSKD